MLDVSQSCSKLMKLTEELEHVALPPEEDPFESLYDGMDFMDDVSGVHLNKKLAIQARKSEIDHFKNMSVHTKVRRRRGMKIISTKWLDINKGDEFHPNCRARLRPVRGDAAAGELAHDAVDLREQSMAL